MYAAWRATAVSGRQECCLHAPNLDSGRDEDFERLDELLAAKAVA
jgi:hypothetical protein